MYEYRDRISQLQSELIDKGIDYYLVPLSDYHSSEIPNDYYNVIYYLTGFSGSNATLVVTRDSAYLWTDGRYFIQAEIELEGTNIILMKQGLKGVLSVEDFLDARMGEEDVLAFDGRTINVATYEKLNNKLLRTNPNRHICDADIISDIWTDRNKLESTDIWRLSDKYAGESLESKLSRIREDKEFNKADAVFVSDLCDVAWTLNLRGDDISHVKVFYSYLIITRRDVILYVNTSCVGKVRGYLEDNGVIIKEYDEIYEDLSNSSFYQSNEIYKILIDELTANTSLYSLLSERIEVLSARSIISNMKCIKNETEISNTRKAHIKDGVAVTKFMYYLQKTFAGGHDSSRDSYTELSLAHKLHELRSSQDGFIDESFDTISAWAEHGAIVHYEPTPKTDVVIGKNNFLLVDSGGHYMEGTTDITRTFLIGKATPKMIRDYTLVLKSNIALAKAIFYDGTGGKSLDMLSRNVMWQHGYDFLHGTGHGVGYILSVHEGPNNISIRSPKDVKIVPGMITTDEPGIYIEGEYGIRLENELLCNDYGSDEYGRRYNFECLTLVPFQLECVDTKMLTDDEKAYLNEYHALVYDKISPYFNDDEKEWLREATKSI